VNPKKFFAELKRRNVYKVAVAYAIVGWLVMQIAATVVPALHHAAQGKRSGKIIFEFGE
jgi:hypothetical protein